MQQVNVIVICLDTWRADLIGSDQKLSHVHTPNLDQFAREAVTFDRAFGEGQPTLQARRSFFTGMRCFPWRFNVDRRQGLVLLVLHRQRRRVMLERVPSDRQWPVLPELH